MKATQNIHHFIIIYHQFCSLILVAGIPYMNQLLVAEIREKERQMWPKYLVVESMIHEYAAELVE